MNFLDIGWLWVYAGLGMMLAELLSPGFVLFFFGLSGMTVGAIVLLLPETAELAFKWQLALFTVFSIVYILTLRRFVKKVFLGDNGKGSALPDEFAGRVCVVISAIEPDMPGRVMLGDAEWNAEADGESIPEGAKVRVVSRRNLTLCVKKL